MLFYNSFLNNIWLKPVTFPKQSAPLSIKVQQRKRHPWTTLTVPHATCSSWDAQLVLTLLPLLTL